MPNRMGRFDRDIPCMMYAMSSVVPCQVDSSYEMLPAMMEPMAIHRRTALQRYKPAALPSSLNKSQNSSEATKKCS